MLYMLGFDCATKILEKLYYCRYCICWDHKVFYVKFRHVVIAR